MLLSGLLDVGAGISSLSGQLDIGELEVLNGFQNITIIGAGILPGLINALCFTDTNGVDQLTFSVPAMPPMAVGFQGYVYALPAKGCLTNAIEVSFQ